MRKKVEWNCKLPMKLQLLEDVCMRLRKSRLIQMYLYNRSVVKDREGETSEGFSESGLLLDGEWWLASGKLQAELYGQRLPYIRNIRLNEPYETCPFFL